MCTLILLAAMQYYGTRLRSRYRSISAQALRAARGLRPPLFSGKIFGKSIFFKNIFVDFFKNIFCGNIFFKNICVDFFLAKILLSKVILKKYFQQKYFQRKYFPQKNIFSENIFCNNIFGKNIFSLQPLTVHYLYTTPTPLIPYLKLRGGDKRTHGPDAHTQCLFYSIRLRRPEVKHFVSRPLGCHRHLRTHGRGPAQSQVKLI